MENLISIGKILNFHGIQGEAKVGFSSAKRLEEAKCVLVKNQKLTIEKVRFHKNTAIVKFKEIKDINELLAFKGENIYLVKDEVKNSLEEEEYLIDELIGLNVFDDKDDLVGVVEFISKNAGNDLLSIKPEIGKNILIPFVKELVPIVDIKAKRIVIKPIEGLLP